jgi:rhodanese-related sulfurtransferase
MKLRDGSFVSIIVALLTLPVLAADPSRPYPTDAQTGRAIGANQMAAQELKQKLDSGEPVMLIEVRDVSFYEKETIPGTIHIPFARLQEAMKDIPKDRTLVFICGTGRQSSQAAKLAEDQGYKTAAFCPIQSWKEQGYPTEPGKTP